MSKRKVYKTITQENGTITFYGSNRSLKLYNATPEWSEGEKEYFIYEGKRHYLDEFVSKGFAGASYPDYMAEFDAWANDTFFSGLAVKLVYDDREGEYKVKVYLYIS